MRKVVSLFILAFLLTALHVDAQTGCPSVYAGEDTTLLCGHSCVTLHASAFSAAQTTSYSVDPISYNPPFPFNAGTPILVSIDDHWSDVIHLPFSFCYFGTPYTDLIAGSNGVVSFDTTNANAYNTYPIGAPIPSATPADLLNSIMGPWHDIDPSIGGGYMYYQIAGTAPCRMVVFSWDSVAMFQFSCNSLKAYQQIVLYEGTNAIEIYLGNKPLCTSWNGGAAIEGIQNATGTVAYVVPGRNYPSQWTAYHDGYRFTPNGPPSYAINWFQGNGAYIASGDSVQVCPAVATDYVAIATYFNCSLSSLVVKDTVRVVPGGSGVTITSLQKGNVTCNAGYNGYAKVFTNGGIPPLSYIWYPPAMNADIVSGLVAGNYSIAVYDSVGCRDSVDFTITEPLPVTLSVSGDTVICIGQNAPLTAVASGGNGNYNYTWSNSIIAPSQFVSPVRTMLYTVIAADDSGCISHAQNVIVTVNPPLDLNMTHAATICQGESALIGVTASGGDGGPYSLLWSTGDVNVDSITVAPLLTTTYSVTLSDNCGTPTDVSSLQVVVHNTPVVDFIPHFYAGCQPLEVEFNDLTINGDPNSRYTWNFGDGVIDDSQQNPTHVYNQSGYFTVTLDVKTPDGCRNSETVPNAVHVLPKPVSQFDYAPQEITILFPDVWFKDNSRSAVKWDWDFGDSIGTSTDQSPSYRYKNAGSYDVQLIVTSNDGCLDTLVERLIVDGDFTLYIPKAFTPNGDGVNDAFSPTGFDVKDFQMDIFDRWGQVVFQTDNVNEPWYGSMQKSGKMCKQDVYVFKVTAHDFKNVKHEIVGEVNLIY